MANLYRADGRQVFRPEDQHPEKMSSQELPDADQELNPPEEHPQTAPQQTSKKRPAKKA